MSVALHFINELNLGVIYYAIGGRNWIFNNRSIWRGLRWCVSPLSFVFSICQFSFYVFHLCDVFVNSFICYFWSFYTCIIVIVVLYSYIDVCTAFFFGWMWSSRLTFNFGFAFMNFWIFGTSIL